MIRVLHIMAGADAGGISAVVLNYYKYINKEEFHFDIAITADEIGMNGKKLMELNANIYHLPLKSQGLQRYQEELTKLLQTHPYDVIHVHDSETSYVAMRIAKKMGIKKRVAHSHTTSPYVSVKGELRRLAGCFLNYYYATHVIGCGQLAGERVFGKRNMKRKKAHVLPNAIELETFRYDAAVREEVRAELGVDGKFVLGMIARIAPQKNQLFGIQIFEKIRETNPDAVLVLAGNGPDEEKVLTAIQNSRFSQDILFLGRRTDACRLYQAFDVFLMPSIYEGFPVAGVEAMASGLPILLSDKITKELAFYTGTSYLSLGNADVWAEAALAFKEDNSRQQRQNELKGHHLEISETAAYLEKLYR